MIDGPFGNHELVGDGAGNVVKFSVSLDGRGDIAARTVELLHRSQVFFQSNQVGGLSGLGVQQRLQDVAVKLFVARPVPSCDFVLEAGRNGESDVDDGDGAFVV